MIPLNETQAIIEELKQIRVLLEKSIPEPLLLSIPDFQRKTLTVLMSLGEATAEMVAEVTGRARAVESQYLNILVRDPRFNVSKERRSHTVWFIFRKEVTNDD